MSEARFGDRMVAAMKAQSISRAELQRRSGVSYDVLRELERRPDSSTSEANAVKIAPALGMLLDDGAPVDVSDAAPETALIPIYDVTASAGHGAVVEYEQQIDSLALPRDYLRKLTDSPQSLGIISVKGDSMAPTLRGGDFVLVDVSKTSLAFDGLFVLDLDGALHVKRVTRGNREGVVRIVSDNRSVFEPFEREIAEVRVVGKVLLTVRRE